MNNFEFILVMEVKTLLLLLLLLLFFFSSGYTVVPVAVVEKTNFSPLYHLWFFVKGQFTDWFTFLWITSGLSILFHSSMYLLFNNTSLF